MKNNGQNKNNTSDIYICSIIALSERNQVNTLDAHNITSMYTTYVRGSSNDTGVSFEIILSRPNERPEYRSLKYL